MVPIVHLPEVSVEALWRRREFPHPALKSLRKEVEAPGIEPGSENSEATCVYVRIRPIESSWIAPAGGLSPGLFTCLISPRPR